jgi:hypothetical protein
MGSWPNPSNPVNGWTTCRTRWTPWPKWKSYSEWWKRRKPNSGPKPSNEQAGTDHEQTNPSGNLGACAGREACARCIEARCIGSRRRHHFGIPWHGDNHCWREETRPIIKKRYNSRIQKADHHTDQWYIDFELPVFSAGTFQFNCRNSGGLPFHLCRNSSAKTVSRSLGS